MPKTVEAIFENGVFKPLKKIHIKERERVELIISTRSELKKEVKKALSIIGIGKSYLKDTSAKHDEYLYGQKRHLLKSYPR